MGMRFTVWLLCACLTLAGTFAGEPAFAGDGSWTRTSRASHTENCPGVWSSRSSRTRPAEFAVARRTSSARRPVVSPIRHGWTEVTHR